VASVGQESTGPGDGEGLNLGPLAEALAFHIRLAQAASFRGFQRRVELQHLKPGWYAVLSLINDNPGITPAAVGRASGRDKSTMTPVLRELESEGLIARLDVPEDRRCKALQLTPAGVDALQHLRARALAHDAALDAIAGDDKAVVLDVLRRVVAAFD
jgi:DNA-binding MarR family transcriptional regulator